MRLVKRSFLASAVLLLAVGSVQAMPINYSFSGTSVGEFNNANGAPVGANLIYAGGTSISGTFTYDAAAPVAGFAPVPGYNNAPFTVYGGAFSDMDMTVGGATASADLGVGMVGNNVSPTNSFFQLDVLLGYSEASNSLSGFNGFGVGDWTLDSLAFVFFNAPTTFIDNSLPATVAASSNLMELMFSNSIGESQKVRFSLSAVDIVPAVSVPEPATAFLFGIGIAGLMARRAIGKKAI